MWKREICPYCTKVVNPDDDDFMVINNSGTVCHGTCHKEAIENAKNRVYMLKLPRPTSES